MQNHKKYSIQKKEEEKGNKEQMGQIETNSHMIELNQTRDMPKLANHTI